ncbi:hypothetical protein [Pararhizobium sp.]|uniref:hypothetical protein n=1 Tax=Pararhizobium sp. TaxID=1977563 RepID=UPI00271FB61C|nr:hypothetical protein [Pararhizobium sp.]MDO9417957.1 hypothetical protein [Pararhizobium sp.]
MIPDLDFDPALFGAGVRTPVYDGLRARERCCDDAGLEALAGRVVLELKAEAQVSPAGELSDMLALMTRELREQLQAFQRMREAAQGGLAAVEGPDTDAGAGGAIDRKQLQADAKASIEAMSVIVRTLEKIDSLQRTLAHDRDRQAGAAVDADGYKALVEQFQQRLESRAEERAHRLFEDWKQKYLAASLPAADGVERDTGPPG